MHLTTHMARLHDFGGMEQIVLTALNGNENSLFESRWTDTLHEMLEEDIEYRRGINFYEKNWKDNIREKIMTPSTHPIPSADRVASSKERIASITWL